MDEDPQTFKEVRKLESSIARYEKIILDCRTYQGANPFVFYFGDNLEEDPLWIEWSPSLDEQQKKHVRRHHTLAKTVAEAHDRASEFQHVCTLMREKMKIGLELDHRLGVLKTRGGKYKKPPLPIRDESGIASTSKGAVQRQQPVKEKSAEQDPSVVAASEQRTTAARKEEKSLMRNQMITPDHGDPDGSDPDHDSEGSSDEKKKPVFRSSVKPRIPMKPKKAVCAPVPYEDSSDESELDWLPEEDDEISDGGRAARRWAG
ncbi:MAG: hypothetical protein GY696_12445, partial [Gammaproteobacteria bacterium]|nr:hypothetical protein [Gammaproteobacteria bacterium]